MLPPPPLPLPRVAHTSCNVLALRLPQMSTFPNAYRVEKQQCYAPESRRGDVPPAPPAETYTVRRVRPVAPPAQANWEGAAAHWQHSLEHARRMTELLRDKSQLELQAAEGERRQRTAQHLESGLASGDLLAETVAARRAVNASLDSQVQFFNACVQAWAGPPCYHLA